MDNHCFPFFLFFFFSFCRGKTAYRNTAQTHHKSPMSTSGSEQEAFAKLMSEVDGCFTHLCEKCHDSTPPIMCLKSAIGPHCSAHQHPWEPNQVLVNILDMEGEQVRYLKIRQLPRNSLLKLCPDVDKQSGCIQGNSCRRAHNKVKGPFKIINV